MENFSENEFNSLEETINSKFPQQPQLLNSYVQTDPRYARLFKGLNKKPVSISKDTREFDLDEIFYIRRIEVFSKEIVKTLKGLSIKIITHSGEERELEGVRREREDSDGSKQEYIQYIFKGIAIKAQVKSRLSYRSLSIVRVNVIGYSLSMIEAISTELSKATDVIYGVDSYISNKKKEVDRFEVEIADAKEEKKAINASIESLRAEEASAKNDVEAVQKQQKLESEKLTKINGSLQAAENRLQAVTNNSEQLSEKINGLNKEIAAKTRDLEQLVSDRNLISDEYKDYVSEGKNQARNYMLFLIAPVAIIGFCSWQLYSGAANILDTEINNFQHLFALFLQRVPFATAIALVVGVCWKLSSELIKRIMHIHGQRLTLAKLLVIAKDVVYSSSVGLDLTEEQRLRQRMLLKLEMLKSHLASELGTEFEYRDLVPGSDGRSKKLEASLEDAEVEEINLPVAPSRKR